MQKRVASSARRVGTVVAAATLLCVAGCGTGPIDALLGGASGLSSAQGLLSSGSSAQTPETVQAEQAEFGLLQPHFADPVTWNNQLALYPDRQALPVLQAMLAGARHNIWIETFELHDDNAGVALTNLLIQKHEEGVDVHVIVDHIGEMSVHGTMPSILQQNGVPTLVYGPFPYWNSQGKGFNITHRKCYLVDGDQAMTGGMNLGDAYFDSIHDMLWKVDGAAANQLHKEFAIDWKLGGGSGTLTVPPLPAKTYGNEPIGIAVTSPREPGREHEIHETLLAAINNAKTRIDMGYPFYWDDAVMSALDNAVKRGVQVHVILTTHDLDIFHKINLWAAKEGMAAGLQFRYWDPSYAHIKYCVIDNDYLQVGSSNADSLTFYNNQELDLELTDPSIVSMFRSTLSDPDWASSSPITPQDVAQAGVNKPVYDILTLLGFYM